MFKKNKHLKASYSQSGEDRIVDFIMSAIGIERPTYFDIGAHHPYYLSNTALFYAAGSRGVCIEPDPVLFKKIRKIRKQDICLNVGVGLGQDAEADFYIMSTPSLSTFSKKHALEYESYGNVKISKIIKIPLISINEIIEKHFKSIPNFVSLDIEGLDYDILKSFDFSKYRPEVFCLETLTYTENNAEKKIVEFTEFMKSNNYIAYADTYINTIYVDKDTWVNRNRNRK
jgi:FkbM family methyltransferase